MYGCGERIRYHETSMDVVTVVARELGDCMYEDDRADDSDSKTSAALLRLRRPSRIGIACGVALSSPGRKSYSITYLDENAEDVLWSGITRVPVARRQCMRLDFAKRVPNVLDSLQPVSITTVLHRVL